MFLVSKSPHFLKTCQPPSLQWPYDTHNCFLGFNLDAFASFLNIAHDISILIFLENIKVNMKYKKYIT